MGLTIIAFLVLPVFLANIIIVRRRFRGTAGALITQGISLSFALFTFFQVVALVMVALAPLLPLSNIFTKLSGFFLAGAYILLFTFVLDFPVELPAILRIAGYLAAFAAAALAGWDILFTTDYVLSTVRVGSDIVRVDGPQYGFITDLETLLAAVSAAFLLARSLAVRSRIHRQRALVAFVGVVLGAGAVWALPSLITSRSVVRSAFALIPLASLVLASVVTYAYYLSRFFDWRAIGRRIRYYAVLGLVIGLPTGAAILGLGYLGSWSELVPYIGAPLVFLVAFLLARRLSTPLQARMGGRGEYRAELEDRLSGVDLSRGRDVVLDEIYNLLSQALDFSDFTVLIEDDRGDLRSVYAPTGGKALIERASPLAEAIEASGATVLLKSEAVADPAYAEARQELLGFFESLQAEAVIIIREGRRVIGAFALGARRTGADYTDYDYETFKSVYGKLFVFAYYLKNIARESILHTVDRELALSDQIIRFALENVDKFEHPKADTAWAMRSTRRLGGDFVDFVRLSPDRWFFVMGDVSGKGLSASMNMLILKSMIRTFLRVEKDFVGLVSRVNDFIKDNLPRGNFFAGIFGYFDLSKDAFYYINCGVPTVLLYSPSFDTFIEVQGEGRVLGFVRNVGPFLKPRKLLLAAGSALVAATDGVTDSENLRGERFGKDKLRRSVRDRLSSSSRQIADGVIEDLLSFTDHKQEDDITLLVMKFTPRSSS